MQSVCSLPRSTSSSLFDITIMPELPWDVLLVVFSLSDAPTLAALGGVSLDFLAATSPLLHTDVEVTSFPRLEALFCKREQEISSSNSRITHLLDLNQMKTLNLDFTSRPTPSYPLRTIPSSLPLSFDRITTHLPLPIDLLRIGVKFSQRDTINLFHANLLPRLNPRRIEYLVPDRPRFESPSFYVHGGKFEGWTLIQQIDLRGIIPWSPSENALANLPTPSLDHRRTVRLHLPTLVESRIYDMSTLTRLHGRSRMLNLQFMQEGSMVMVVETEEQRREVEASISNLGGTAKLFAVEVDA